MVSFFKRWIYQVREFGAFMRSRSSSLLVDQCVWRIYGPFNDMCRLGFLDVIGKYTVYSIEHVHFRQAAHVLNNTMLMYAVMLQRSALVSS